VRPGIRNFVAAWTLTVSTFAQMNWNPEAIAREIDGRATYDWDALLAKLQVKPGIPPCGNGREMCTVELVSIFDPDQQILFVTGANGQYSLRFLKQATDGRSWEFGGLYQVGVWNEPARHDVQRIGRVPYLRLYGQGIRGSDWNSEHVAVFDLSRKQFDPVYTYNAQGHEQRLLFGIMREVRSTVAIDARGELLHSLDVQLKALDLPMDPIHLEITADYRYDAGAGRFVFQSATDGSAKLSEKAFRELADIDHAGPASERLIELAFAGLKDFIARSTNPAHSARLRRMLAECKDTPEVRELRRLIK
jgi:hypothetical protein